MRHAPLLFLIILVAGCVSAPADVASSTADMASLGTAWQRTYVLDGERGPLDAPTRSAFEVPEGAAQVEALLTWRQPGALLSFRLLDPAGEEAARGWNEADGRAYVTTTHPVVPGTWALEISSEQAVAVAYGATVTVDSLALPHGPIVTTFVIPPQNPARALPPELRSSGYGAFPRDFAEVNLNMDPGDTFNFSWTSTNPVYFNVHYHGKEGTERPIEERSARLEGSFVANMTEVYALLWRNEGMSEVEITLKLDGSYRLHSMTRRA